MFGMSQVIKIISILIIVSIIAGGLWYVTGLRADLAISQANEKAFEEAIKTQNELIEAMKKILLQFKSQ